MSLAEVLAKNTFPEEPLDSKDRKLIEVVFEGGVDGIGFNRLVARVIGFASRSTVAARVGRLVRLGYLERRPEKGRGRERPIRLTFKCFTLMTIVAKTREAAAKLRSEVEEMQGKGSVGEADLKRWWGEFRERYNANFGMVGAMAIFYGTSAAGDLFLPLIVEDYKALSTRFMGMLRSRPDWLRSLREVLDERAGARGVDLEEVRRKARQELLDSATHRFRAWEDGVRLGSG